MVKNCEPTDLVKKVLCRECEFNNLRREDPELDQFVNNLDIHVEADPREALQGGRTESFTLRAKAGEGLVILAADICSLYPSQMWKIALPVGHPIIGRKGLEPAPIFPSASDDDTMRLHLFGFYHIKILPPQDEWLPVLGIRSKGKTLYALCR